MPIDPEVQKVIDDLKAQLTPEALAKVLGPSMGDAVKAHLGTAMKGVVTADGLKAQLDELAKSLKPTADDEDKGKNRGDGKPDPAVAALQKRVDEAEARQAAAEKARIDTERKAVVDGNRNAARDMLVKAGLAPDKAHLWMPAVEASGQLVLEGEKVGWMGKDTYGAPTVLDFEAGAKAWASSPDGKHFLPPTDTRGTGDGGGNRNDRSIGTGPGRNPDGSLNLNALGRLALSN